MKNILLAIDFDEQVADLIEYAEEFAEKFKAKLFLIHVAAPNPEFVGYETGPQYVRDCRADELNEELRSLKSFSDKLESKGIATEALLIQGQTVEMILEQARNLSVDLIISGSQEPSFFSSFFHESISLELFKQSEIPLLTVPRKEK
jgi:nucleotide-binding universal stress UspA family protein